MALLARSSFYFSIRLVHLFLHWFPAVDDARYRFIYLLHLHWGSNYKNFSSLVRILNIGGPAFSEILSAKPKKIKAHSWYRPSKYLTSFCLCNREPLNVPNSTNKKLVQHWLVLWVLTGFLNQVVIISEVL